MVNIKIWSKKLGANEWTQLRSQSH